MHMPNKTPQESIKTSLIAGVLSPENIWWISSVIAYIIPTSNVVTILFFPILNYTITTIWFQAFSIKSDKNFQYYVYFL